MKRSFSLGATRSVGTIVAGTGVIAATYGLVRLAYGLFLPDVQAELRLTDVTAGSISSGASIVYCLGAVGGFFLSSRHARLLVGGAGLSAGIGAAGMASSHGEASFAVFAVVGSLGAGLASPGLVSIIRNNVAADARDRSQAVVNAGTGPGLVLAGLLALFLLPDWRAAWFTAAAIATVAAAAVLLLDHGDVPTTAGHRRQRVPPMSWLRAHAIVVIAAFLMGAGSAAVWTYGRVLLVETGMSERLSIVAWIALGVGGTAVIGTTRLLDSLSPRARWATPTVAVSAAMVVLVLASHSTGMALVACAVFGWGYVAASGALITWTTAIDTARAPAGTSLLFVVLILGQALGSSGLGAMTAITGFGSAFLLAGAITFAAAVIPLVARPRSLERRSRARRGRGGDPRTDRYLFENG